MAGLSISPPRILVLGFTGVITLGAVLLSLPVASASGQALPFLDALFTATSAVCVTGLVVVDTAIQFSTFGQVVILALIQVGGLGFMTFATLIGVFLGRKIGLRERLLLQESLNRTSLEGVVRLVKYVVAVTLIFEATGALILALRWGTQLGWGKGIYYGVFHAVSAFNNAGFDLFGTITGPLSGLTSFTNDPVVSLVIPFLIIIGGLGFSVLDDLFHNHRWHALTLHTKLVLYTTAVLLLLGFGVILALEYTNPQTLGKLSAGERLLAAFFQGVTPRTAGFNTVDIGSLKPATLLFMVILMFIGASPGSTGGGIKTTTFANLAVTVWSTLQGREEPVIFKRSLTQGLVVRSLAVASLGIFLVLGTTMALAIVEGNTPLHKLLFEATSAFGTVGLSTGITPLLASPSKIMIIITMFAGRVGPLTLALALSRRRKNGGGIGYPKGRVMIG